jgi:hypothetical protein
MTTCAPGRGLISADTLVPSGWIVRFLRVGDRLQIIEVTGAGVRSAVIRLQRRDSPLRFVLFPMIHLGRSEFYQAVRERAGRCAVIVAEGQPGSKPRASLAGLAYRLLRRRRRGRLVAQNVDEYSLGVPVVRPDLSLEAIRLRLRRLPWGTYVFARLGLWIILPWVALYVLLFGSARFLAHEMGLDDDTPDTEQSAGKRWDSIDEVIVDERDALLIDALSQIHENMCGEAAEIAVIYGARHMPAVIRALFDRYGYRARGAEWLTVFGLDD